VVVTVRTNWKRHNSEDPEPQKTDLWMEKKSGVRMEGIYIE
jgi:hypothetical protein